jgi:hypothetical protein
MKIVFAMLHTSYLRHFGLVVNLLAQRGHNIHLIFSREDRLGESPILEDLRKNWPNITFSELPQLSENTWYILLKNLRLFTDYLRYLHPRYENAPKLRSRAGRRLPPYLLALTRLPFLKTEAGNQGAIAFLKKVERVIPRDRVVETIVREQAPDLVLVSPLIDLGSDQCEYVRAAKALGVRTGLCVCSWDNLTNKGIIRDIPDIVTVWNEAQKQEAVELHGVPPQRVKVTGSPSFDHWFEWQPSQARAEFCQMVGLDVTRPYLLYLCSSGFIAPEEVGFVKKWIHAIRNAPSSQLKDIGILIRPHPQNAQQWEAVDFSTLDNVVIWPRGGQNPVDANSKAGYYHSMYYCAAVVGINTSAQIEAGILGRSVYTILTSDFAETQEGTLHFQHLTQVNGGLLHIAQTFEEHLEQIAQALESADEVCHKSQRFIEAFVRPYGLDVSATPFLVKEIEALGQAPAPMPQESPLWVYFWRPPLYLLALVSNVVYPFYKKTEKQGIAAGIQFLFKPLNRLVMSVKVKISSLKTKLKGISDLK